MCYRFVPECNHAQVIHVDIFVFFFAIRQDHGLLRSRILLPWQRDVTTSPVRLAY